MSILAEPLWKGDFGERKEPIQWSDSRELVLVTSGNDYLRLKLSETHPDICWKYIGSSVLIHYHFNLVNSLRPGQVPSHRATATTPIFYAKVLHDFSPIDFAVQPKPFEKARDQLSRLLNEFYRTNRIDFDSDDQIFPDVPCVALINGNWCRGRVIEARINDNADSLFLIALVDYGNANFVAKDKVKPLKREFGRLPPLAMRCRMKDVSCNDLELQKLAEFKDILDNVQYSVRVELATVDVEPFLVNLYHPTISGHNLASTFYRRPLNQAQIAREKRMLAKNTRTTEEIIDDYHQPDMDYDSSDDDDEDAKSPPPHVWKYERCGRPFISPGQWATISHVENSSQIYVHSAEHIDRNDRMEEQLAAMGKTIRAFINDTLSDGYLDVRAVDHGWSIPIKLADSAGVLKALPRQFDFCPQVYVVRLEGQSEPAHCSMTQILRRLLPIGGRVQLAMLKSKGPAPHKVRLLTMEDGRDVVELLNERMREERVIHPCYDLLPYQPEQVALLRPSCFFEPPTFLSESRCPLTFSKGKLEYADLIG